MATEVSMADAEFTAALANEAIATSGVPGVAGNKRKRSGRPCVGGKGNSWNTLLSFFQHDVKAAKPKNGLPGVPYTLKNTVSALKTVWTLYMPDAVDRSASPEQWRWLVDSSDGIIEKIMGDVYTPGAGKLLQALSDACALLAKRTTGDYVTDEQAPLELFTQAVVDKYAKAAQACSPTVLTLADPAMKNFVSFADVQRLRERMSELERVPDQNADTLRMLAWGHLVLEFCSPADGVPDSIRIPPRVKTDFLNNLMIDRGQPLDKDVNTVAQVGGDILISVRKNAHPYVRKLEGKAKALMNWALSQRTGAEHLERLLPRRLNTDRILRRLSKGPLKPALEGRTLTASGLRSAWVSHHCREVLQSVEQQLLERMGLEKADPLQVLSYGILPKYVDTVKTLAIAPLVAANASELVADA